jgi:hypothetical protein
MAFEESFVRVVGTDPLVQALVGGLVIAISNLFGARSSSSIAIPRNGSWTAR